MTSSPAPASPRGFPEIGLRAVADQLENAHGEVDRVAKLAQRVLCDAIDSVPGAKAFVVPRCGLTADEFREVLAGHRRASPGLLRRVAQWLPRVPAGGRDDR